MSVSGERRRPARRVVAGGTTTAGAASGAGLAAREGDPVEHRTETRRSFWTSEFWVFLIVSIAVLFFTYENGRDSLGRDDGWRYVTALAVAYLISRGLAKAGSVERYVRRRGDEW